MQSDMPEVIYGWPDLHSPRTICSDIAIHSKCTPYARIPDGVEVEDAVVVSKKELIDQHWRPNGAGDWVFFGESEPARPETPTATDAATIADLKAKLGEAEKALKTIAAYGKEGICPYGCDTPYIAEQALATPTGDSDAYESEGEDEGDA